MFNLSRRVMKRRSPRPAGFSLMEMLAVLGVSAILMLLGLAAYDRQRPYFEVRADVRSVASAVQRARLAAINGQRPVRVTIDCTQAVGGAAEVCQLSGQQVFFLESGEGVAWRTLDLGDGGAARSLNRNTAIIYRNEPAPSESARYERYKAFFQLSPVVSSKVPGSPPLETSNVVLVFLCLPGGEIVSRWGPPLDLLFVSKAFNRDRTRLAWNLNLTATTGQVKTQRL
ncbi:MAG: prepilin-type N-terminal cleavage/methylation domain-containing protein [Candidatus Adiutrix sp.]|jgi:prepilin-type N-terminal cleavage/methylation domain-containing protein|nr:prepilin-type N-terminal cleavage/methylation domain-containing protein [Candidatus Adiutrix sp.]